MASSEQLSAAVASAADGQLPDWADVSPSRRAHMARVATLMADWAERLSLGEVDRARWTAVGWLHDALRDADPAQLRPLVPAELRDLEGPLLHGPAAATRLGELADAEFCDAVRFHTIGHPDFGMLGRALYLADFLEPGRDFSAEWRASLRDRLPTEMDAVLREVVRARIIQLLDEAKPIRPETAAFWSRLAVEAKR